MQNITIRDVEEKDVEFTIDIFYKTWMQVYPNKEVGITTEDIEEYFKNGFEVSEIERRKKFIKESDKTKFKFLVAERDGKLLGLCSVNIKENEETKETFGKLQAIYILPEYQRQGIGKMFWVEILKFFEDQKKVIVHLAVYNENAKKFYESLGFVDTGKRFVEERHRMPVSQVCIPEMEMEYIK